MSPEVYWKIAIGWMMTAGAVMLKSEASISTPRPRAGSMKFDMASLMVLTHRDLQVF